VPTDVYFLLDSSTSVNPDNFIAMLHFIIDVIDMFDVTSGVTRVAVVGYNDGIHPFILLNNDYSPSQLKDRILGLPYLGGGTKTGSAFQYLRQTGLTHARQEAAQVVILLTDGQSEDPDMTHTEARKLRDQGVHLFAIGIGYGVDIHELRGIGSKPVTDTVFRIQDFSALSAIKAEVAVSACSGECAYAFYTNVTVVS